MTRNHRRWHAWVWLLLGPLIVAGFVVGLLARPAPVFETARFSEPAEAKKSDTIPLKREVAPERPLFGDQVEPEQALL